MFRFSTELVLGQEEPSQERKSEQTDKITKRRNKI